MPPNTLRGGRALLFAAICCGTLVTPYPVGGGEAIGNLVEGHAAGSFKLFGQVIHHGQPPAAPAVQRAAEEETGPVHQRPEHGHGETANPNAAPSDDRGKAPATTMTTARAPASGRKPIKSDGNLRAYRRKVWQASGPNSPQTAQDALDAMSLLREKYGVLDHTRRPTVDKILTRAVGPDGRPVMTSPYGEAGAAQFQAFGKLLEKTRNDRNVAKRTAPGQPHALAAAERYERAVAEVRAYKLHVKAWTKYEKMMAAVDRDEPASAHPDLTPTKSKATTQPARTSKRLQKNKALLETVREVLVRTVGPKDRSPHVDFEVLPRKRAAATTHADHVPHSA